jgi:2-polyprenyl-3-methyl-5-hydroxy-6-metoxy-1,4-benzoquinol methylase
MKDINIYDFGCGCGMMLMDLFKAGYTVLGIDSNALALDYCRKRGVNALEAEISQRVPWPDASADCITMLDVLEHVDDEVKVLTEAKRMLKPEGVLIATVPAYPWLWTERDEFHHHKRRYLKNELVTLFEHFSEFEIITCSYINCFLFPLALFERLYRKFFLTKRPGDLKIPRFG